MAMTTDRVSARAHAERMDRNYRWQRHVYDLTRRWYLLGRDRTIAGLAPPAGGSVLEVGCGTARNLIAVGRCYPDCRLFGLDISAMMLETARGSLARSGLADRVRLAEADATTFDAERLFGLAHVDRVLISYALSMVPDWPSVIDRALAAAGPRGEVHIVDFGTLERLPGSARRALEAWLAHFHVTPRSDLTAVLRAKAAACGASVSAEPLFRTYATHAVLRGSRSEGASSS
jgi:S-adenosylmethionine-diacylgycerolhomoserine-N-methlytransferase